MNKLNPQQEKAAKFYDGVCAVIAIPGSGKTLTMTERIGRLIKDYRVPPESILGLTFTRNAAQAMKERLSLVLSDTAQRVTLSTIHSFSLRVLRTEGRMFELLTGKEQIIFVKKILQQMRIRDVSVGMALRDISLAKNNLISVDEFYSLYHGDSLMTKIADIYKAYEEGKEDAMLLDLDDLLFETYRLLSEDEEVREKYRNMFRHVLIDEFQDSNPAQIAILKLLVDGSESGSSFWACGDENQAIFSYTGSSVSSILNFDRIFPGSSQVVLDINYRSTPQILKVCQNLMRHNARKIEKTLTTQNENGDDVVTIESTSEEDEAVQLVNEVLDLVSRRGFAFKDIAVLYRTNFQSRVVEEAFSEHEIPYHVENGLNFYQRFEIKILLDYARLIQNPDSDEGDEALRSIINIPNRYIGKSFMGEIEAFAIKKDVHFYRGLKSMPVKVPYLKKNVKDFIKFMDPLMKKKKKMAPAELIHLLRDSLDYDRFITEDDVPSADDIKVANLDQLEAAAAAFTDLPTFLDHVESFDDTSGNDKEGVALMTVHRSKGLEFPVVFVIGLIDGLMPHKQGEIEEERRICFVALSRAMRLLYLCHSQTYLGKPTEPSIFLSEIHDE